MDSKLSSLPPMPPHVQRLYDLWLSIPSENRSILALAELRASTSAYPTYSRSLLSRYSRVYQWQERAKLSH